MTDNGKVEKSKRDNVVILQKLQVGAIRIAHAEVLSKKTVEVRRIFLSVESYKERIKRLTKIATELKSRETTFDTLSAKQTKNNLQVDALQRKASVR